MLHSSVNLLNQGYDFKGNADGLFHRRSSNLGTMTQALLTSETEVDTGGNLSASYKVYVVFQFVLALLYFYGMGGRNINENEILILMGKRNRISDNQQL